ncbi:MAG: polysaccharide lyase family protein [Acidobacteriaceae bacterium]|nr:polysaccharide lyase family protein [Acidobacteriaceae bacterium]
MNILRFIRVSKYLRASALLAIGFFLLIMPTSAVLTAQLPSAVASQNTKSAVTVTDNGRSWTLDNGIVKATIRKDSGSMASLVYHGVETMGGNGGYWEQTPQDAQQLTNTINIDPATNGGARAEVSIKGVSGGQIMLGRGAPGGGTYCDMEIRYALGRGDSGIYVYAIFTHPPSYRASGVGAESRYITRLSQSFDWITVDKDRNMLEAAPTDWGTGVVVHAKEQRIMSKGVYKNSVEHKYSYSGVQYKTPAYGWSSTKNHIGIWFINPTIEYLSGGPSKIELDAHFGDNDNPEPIILDYWVGGHYDTGARVNVAAGESWTRVVGPIFVYVNSLDHPKPTSQTEIDTLAATAGNPTVPASWHSNANALWQDALNQAKQQNAKWPYDWVNGVDYPHAAERGTVTGQIVLDDPLAPEGTPKTFSRITVGLTAPDTDKLLWIHNANGYQFWNDGTEDGKFTLTKVRPGSYTLHAFATGVLGDFAQTNITVVAGKTVDLGKLVWKPVRYGTQLWEIGYPDRSGDKFFKGDDSNNWLWGWNLRYALIFPHDITYTVGKSDYRKDWFFEEVPHATNLSFVNPEAKDPANQPFGWVKAESLQQYPQTNHRGPWAIYGSGRTTVWTVKFSVVKAVHGQASLRVALAGVNGLRDGLAVGLNGHSVGAIGDGTTPDNAHLITTNSIRYNADKGLNQQRTLKFDAALLKPGENEMTFTVPGGDLQSGVVWDYLRLELDDNR